MHGVHASSPKQNKMVLDWFDQGKLNLKKYAAGIYALREIDKAFEALRKGDIIKAIVKP